MKGRSRGEKEGGTDGYPLRAAFVEGDGEANRQDATQSHKRFHISDTHRGHGRVCIVCLDRMQKTLRRQGHRLIQNTRGASLVLMVSHLCVCLVNKNLGKQQETLKVTAQTLCTVKVAKMSAHKCTEHFLVLVKSAKQKKNKKKKQADVSPAVLLRCPRC